MPTEKQIGARLDKLQELRKIVRQSNRADKEALLEEIRQMIQNRRAALRAMVMARTEQEEADRQAAHAAREAEIDQLLIDVGLR
jgi:hypothetical protein